MEAINDKLCELSLLEQIESNLDVNQSADCAAEWVVMKLNKGEISERLEMTVK